ncbi:MAG: ComEC/Rec2 family competence protein, partial [Clostridia bacterium]|nr:ComEC/Rec2 family competence protein [Clostridia bacterium]
MHVFHNRPLCVCCCAFVCCAGVAFYLSFTWALILAIAAMLLAFVFLFLYLKKRTKSFFLLSLCLFLAFSAAISSFLFFHVKFPKYQAYVGKECYVEGTVIKNLRPLPYESTFQVELSSINGTPCKIDAKLDCQYASAMQVGDRFSATATARSFQTKNGDETASALKEGMLLAFVCSSHEDCEILEETSNSARIFFIQWNERLSYRLNSVLGKATGALASALLLGNREALDTDVTLAFERCGVTHLLALSGLHISILIGAFDLFLRKLLCPRAPRTAALVLLSLVYLMLTGCAPSTCRAVLMFLILSLGFCWKAEYDSVTALFFALALMIFLGPNAILDIGMWMSFVAAGSIVIFWPLFQKKTTELSRKKLLPKRCFQLLSSLTGAFFVGLIANLGLMLIQVLVFGRLSLMSIPV